MGHGQRLSHHCATASAPTRFDIPAVNDKPPAPLVVGDMSAASRVKAAQEPPVFRRPDATATLAPPARWLGEATRIADALFPCVRRSLHHPSHGEADAFSATEGRAAGHGHAAIDEMAYFSPRHDDWRRRMPAADAGEFLKKRAERLLSR